jgi:hypothetical protein
LSQTAVPVGLPQWRPSAAEKEICVGLTKVYRGILLVNVALMLFQSALAGRMLGGDGRALVFHERTAKLLVIMGCVQLLLATYMRLGSLCPLWVRIASVGLLLAVLIEFAAGEMHNVALHIPLGVAIFGGFLRQLLWSAREANHPPSVEVSK